MSTRTDDWESPPGSPKSGRSPAASPRPSPSKPGLTKEDSRKTIAFSNDGRPPPIPEKPILHKRESSKDIRSADTIPTPNNKPTPPPKPLSKRLSMDNAALQEIHKTPIEVEPAPASTSPRNDSDSKDRRKSMHGTFSGRSLKDRDVLVPPLAVTEPEKDKQLLSPNPTATLNPGSPESTRKRTQSTGSSISSSLKSLLPRASTRGDRTTSQPIIEPPQPPEPSSPAQGRSALAQSMVSPRPAPASPAPGNSSLRASVTNLFGRRSERDLANSAGDEDSQQSGNVPEPEVSPRPSRDSSESTGTDAAWDSVAPPEYLLSWRVVPPPPASAPPPLIGLSETTIWKLEHGVTWTDEKDKQVLTALGLNYPDEERLHYAEGLHVREHYTFISTGPEDHAIGPVVISVEGGAKKRQFRALIRQREGDLRLTLSSPKSSSRDLIRLLTDLHPQYDKVKWKPVTDDDICKDLLELERKQVELLKSYKFGVLLCKSGQTDESEMFRNKEGSADWEEFLQFLGTRIELASWDGYRGGLDVEKNSTGTHSVFANFEGHNIMFHVSTLLPFFPDDAQQLERKRHLGNDVLVIVFKDGDTPFNPACLTSHFTHVVCVVSKVSSNPTQYRISFSHRNGCRPHTPLLTYPCTYNKSDDFRNFLLTKLINAERAALHAPGFAEKLSKARLLHLREIILKYEKSHGGSGIIRSVFSTSGSSIVSALPLVNAKKGSSVSQAGINTSRGSVTDDRKDLPAEPASARTSEPDPPRESEKPLSASVGGSRIQRLGGDKSDKKEKERLEKEAKEKEKEREKLEKERAKAEKEKEKQDKEKEKERQKAEKEREKLEKKSASKEPTPRSDDVKPLTLLWVDDKAEFQSALGTWNKPDMCIKFFASLEEMRMWLLPREARVEGADVRVVTNRHRESDGGSQAADRVVSWVRFEFPPLMRSKILVFDKDVSGLERLTVPKRTYVSSDAGFLQRFATFASPEPS